MASPTSSDPDLIAEGLTAWQDVKRLADELELQMHLARMNARDHWRAFEPKLVQAERVIATAAKRIGDAIAKELSTINGLRADIEHDVEPDEPDDTSND